MKTKVLLSTILTAAILISTFQMASATLGDWEILGKANIQGSSFAYAGKMVRKLSSAQWAGDIVSYTDYPPVAISLGWTYFTTRETCNGSITQQVQKGGTSVYGTQVAATTFMNTMTCNGTRYGYSLGKHEFLGSIIWRPEWLHGDYLP